MRCKVLGQDSCLFSDLSVFNPSVLDVFVFGMTRSSHTEHSKGSAVQGMKILRCGSV